LDLFFQQLNLILEAHFYSLYLFLACLLNQLQLLLLRLFQNVNFSLVIFFLLSNFFAPAIFGFLQPTFQPFVFFFEDCRLPSCDLSLDGLVVELVFHHCVLSLQFGYSGAVLPLDLRKLRVKILALEGLIKLRCFLPLDEFSLEAEELVSIFFSHLFVVAITPDWRQSFFFKLGFNFSI